MAQRRLPGLRGLHGHERVSAGARPRDRAGARRADYGVMRRGGAMAVPSSTDRRRARGAGRERESHPEPGAPGAPHAITACPHSPRGRRTLSRGANRPARDVLAVGFPALSSGRPTRTGVVVRIDGSLGGRLDVWVSRLPAPALVIVGLVMVAGLGWVDFVTGPELTPLGFYLAPVVLVAWYAGRWPGAIIACAGGLAWMFADALTLRDYSRWSCAYWIAVLRCGALVLVSEALARLRLAHARDRELARSDALTGGPNAPAFYEVAAAEITRARRYNHPFSVAYLDLHDFNLTHDFMRSLARDD